MKLYIMQLLIPGSGNKYVHRYEIVTDFIINENWEEEYSIVPSIKITESIERALAFKDKKEWAELYEMIKDEYQLFILEVERETTVVSEVEL